MCHYFCFWFVMYCHVCFPDFKTWVYRAISGESSGPTHGKGRQPGHQESQRPGKKE